MADIFRAHGKTFHEQFRSVLSPEQWQVMYAIEICRTALLGGHLDQCDHCGHQAISYNSCRNRHCPKCQTMAKEKWLQERCQELLPIPYFHVVFTLPEALNHLILLNRRILYHLLFQAASQTLLTLAEDPKHLGAEIGFTAILHTWGQNLLFHPHLHCVVSGGGLSFDQKRWMASRKKFFLPVRVLSLLFRRFFLKGLQSIFTMGKLHFSGKLKTLSNPGRFESLLRKCRQTRWVVYAKKPFGGPQQILNYLGRYTHRIAIANHRLLKLQNGQVSFLWRDYRHANQKKIMTLTAHEFMRRFLLHVLPKGFVRIRHYGFLANKHRSFKLARCRQILQPHAPPPTHPASSPDWRSRYEKLTGKPVDQCPVCRTGKLITIQIIPAPLHPFSRRREPP